ncbi:MAG TPA: UDP-N-acetylmuramate dehydrogenase [Candidatus Limnocylindria bacterium]|nr:UDP-N-acetylmuramate dehydrogenase [Candidatus Limnocylindria bacterium]
MQIQENVPLSQHSTMRLGGPARYLADITDRFEIAEAVAWAEQHQLPVMMIGSGSNIIWGDGGFPGLVLVNKIMGFEPLQQDDADMYVVVGAGENWDETVRKTVDLGYSGIEQLSLIPGTAGATPIQNVGAYGREIKDVLVTVEAYDTQAKQLVNLRADECKFGYRTSRFKAEDKSRFFITSITLHVTKTNPQPPFYPALQSYLETHGRTSYTPQVIRDAVIAIRSSKLPDPSQVANNGSFFHNPIIPSDQAAQLLETYPAMPHWAVDGENTKLSAAWLLEQTGFKDVHDPETGMATWGKQPLVLVNEHARKTADLLQFKQKIVGAVQQKFNVTLVQEPELIA